MEQTTTLESLSIDIALQPDSMVYLCCKTIWFLAVSSGWVEAVLTQQNKSQV